MPTFTLFQVIEMFETPPLLWLSSTVFESCGPSLGKLTPLQLVQWRNLEISKHAGHTVWGSGEELTRTGWCEDCDPDIETYPSRTDCPLLLALSPTALIGDVCTPVLTQRTIQGVLSIHKFTCKISIITGTKKNLPPHILFNYKQGIFNPRDSKQKLWVGLLGGGHFYP